MYETMLKTTFLASFLLSLWQSFRPPKAACITSWPCLTQHEVKPWQTLREYLWGSLTRGGSAGGGSAGARAFHGDVWSGHGWRTGMMCSCTEPHFCGQHLSHDATKQREDLFLQKKLKYILINVLLR